MHKIPSSEFFGDKTAKHLAALPDDAAVTEHGRVDDYRLSIIESARRVLSIHGPLAAGWKYLTQYSSGRCCWDGGKERPVV